MKSGKDLPFCVCFCVLSEITTQGPPPGHLRVRSENGAVFGPLGMTQVLSDLRDLSHLRSVWWS